MPVRPILTMGHPVLARVADPVDDPAKPEVAQIAKDLQDTLDNIGAPAIAAPQIGEPVRIVVWRKSQRFLPYLQSDARQDWVVMVNPVLTPRSESTIMGWERCLSIPGLHGKVPRVAALDITWQDPDRGSMSLFAEGQLSAVLQHEYDHLDGVLYPMRMTDLSLLEFDATPGKLAADVAAGETVWPALQQIARTWTR